LLDIFLELVLHHTTDSYLLQALQLIFIFLAAIGCTSAELVHFLPEVTMCEVVGVRERMVVINKGLTIPGGADDCGEVKKQGRE
jgi:hypothetical protein